MRKTFWRFGAVGALTLAAAAIPTVSASANGPSVRVAADHLNNPRGVSIGLDGHTVYVAEAGNGGAADHGRCDNVPDPESGDKALTCLSLSGAITAVDGTHVWRPIRNLPSLGDPSGVGTTGPADVVDGGECLIVAMQGATLPHHPKVWDPEYSTKFSHLLCGKDPVLDLGAFEAAHDPDHQGVDSDPYGIASNARNTGGVAVDAAGNDLLEVSERGIHVLAVFPNRTVPNPFGPGTVSQQAVPTSVVRGPDGAYYVGELSGFPFTPGSARIWRVVPGHTATVWKDGFTNITGLAFGPDGSLYVSEIAKNGLLQAEGPGGDLSGGLFRIWPNGHKTEIHVPGLLAAGGLAVAKDGTIYQANCSIGTADTPGPCNGQLLAIRQ